ncbi:MAG TPA: hypothetical protein VGN63_04045 [Flavisolibacter sp.]|nr:hypothetical protein [Flavisolibacter sp.]
MKSLLAVVIAVLFIQNIHAQLGPLELMAGDKYLHYQHSLEQPVKPDSPWGWQHIVTLIKSFRTKTEKGTIPDELMNQGYLTFRLHPLLSLKGGLFYTNATGYRPSFSVQTTLHRKNWLVVFAPRVDIEKMGAYELMALVEYMPTIAGNTKLYSRIQAMSNIDREKHNRSYQQFRIGLEKKGYQFGAGLTLDEYGTGGAVHFNSGIFIRRMF